MDLFPSDKSNEVKLANRFYRNFFARFIQVLLAVPCQIFTNQQTTIVNRKMGQFVL